MSVLPFKRTLGVAQLTLFVFVLGLFPVLSHAQQATISGFVTDASDGQPLEGANILLESISGETVKGAAADQDGSYLIGGIPSGRHALTVSFIGYEVYRDTLELSEDEARTVNVGLAPDEEALEEVLVEAEGTAGAARVNAGHQEIRPRDLERIPSPDVAGDLASYLSTQPGVVSVGDRGGKVFIRGGEPSQNIVQLDGMPLYQPFHVLGFYSAFPSDIISNADIYAGGYGSQYGGALSSVIDVSTRTGNKKGFAGAVSASPFISTARLEGPLIKDRLSLIVSGRRSMLDHGASQYIDQPLLFSFSDVFAKLHSKPTEASRLWITGLKTYDRGTLGKGVEGSPAQEVRWENQAIGLHYLILPRWLPVKADLSISRSGLTSEFGPPEKPVRSSSINTTRLAVDATFPGESYEVAAGWTIDFVGLETHLGGMFQNIEEGSPPTLHQIAYYVAPEFRWGGFAVRPGVRMQFYNVRFDPYLEPRLRMSWDVGMHHFSAAGGLYQQEVVGLSDRRDAANVFTAWTNIPRREDDENKNDVRAGRLARAWHGIAGYRVRPNRWFELSVEGYYKELSNLFISEWTAFPRLTTRLQPATGHSYGAETRIELQADPFYGYINYGLSFTRYQARQASLQLWYGTEALDFRPPHDRRHQVNSLLGVTLYGFDLNLQWAFGSGRPFSRAIGFDGFVLVDDIENVANSPGNRRVIYEKPYNGILPAYHRLDVSLERTFVFDAAELTLQGSLINAYNRRNIFYLNVFTLQRADQLPLVPSIGLKLAFE